MRRTRSALAMIGDRSNFIAAEASAVETSVSNCLFWALGQWLREGGALWVEKSRYGWWPHFAWSPDGQAWWCFNPVWEKGSWRWPFPPLFFRGQVKRGKR